jgi:hypothetical protein
VLSLAFSESEQRSARVAPTVTGPGKSSSPEFSFFYVWLLLLLLLLCFEKKLDSKLN